MANPWDFDTPVWYEHDDTYPTFEPDEEPPTPVVTEGFGVNRAWFGSFDNAIAIDYDEEGRKENFNKPLIIKCGGEFKIKALATGNYDLYIYVKLDDGDFQFLGTMNLSGNAPYLPITLPFNLGGSNIITKVFHLDPFGGFNTIQYKIQHNALNGSDDIKIYERTFVTFTEEYQPEYAIQS
jgi:hypothetical protein